MANRVALIASEEDGSSKRVAIKVSKSMGGDSEKKTKNLSKSTGITRSNSIADIKRGITPKQLVRKEVKIRKKTLSMRSTSSSDIYALSKQKRSSSSENITQVGDEEEKTKKKITKKGLKKCETAISCNVSLVASQAEKAMKSREEEIKIGRTLAGAIMQYSHVIKAEDDNSMLAHSLSQAAEHLDLTGELHASWCRNLDRRITAPMKELHEVAVGDESIAPDDITESINSLIGFLGVYSNFFRVGQQKLSAAYDKTMEYRSVVAFNTKDAVVLEKGHRCKIPLIDISIQGTLQKKGAIRQNWKSRWFILYYHRLLYFTNSSDCILQGEIVLENCTVSVTTARKFSHVLNIQTPSRAYLIAFPCEEELKNWQQLIMAATIKRIGPLSNKRVQISLVEPTVVNTASGKTSKPSIKLEQFLRQDMFSRYWRDFRAKEPSMMSWVTEEVNLSDLVAYALAFVPEVTKEEVADLEATIAKQEEVSPKQRSLKRKLSNFSIRKENHTSPSVEELKRANNALLYKHANSAFTILVSSEQMAVAFVKCKTVMIQLFNFMRDEKPPVNPRQFHVFTELIIHLLRHQSGEVFLFLSENPDILHQILVHIGNEHCLRLVLSLWSYTQCEEKVDVLNHLGKLAVTRYFDTDVSEQELDNLTVLIRELIRRHRLLTMRPEAAMILTKMREHEEGTKEITLDEGIEMFTPRSRRNSTIGAGEAPSLNTLHVGDDKKTEKEDDDENEAMTSEESFVSPRPGIMDAQESKATEIFNQVRPRRESDVRRDWVDFSWSGDYEEDVEDSPVSSAPKKPLPNIPARPTISREHLNVNAPNYLEFKTAPFMTTLKNRNYVNHLISFSLQTEKPQRAERSVELIISMLKVHRSKESDTTESVEDEEEHEVVQKSPHMLIMELVKKFPTMAQLLRVPKVDKSTNKVPLLGLFRYNLVRIVRYVIDCGFKFVDQNLLDSKLLSRCIKLMFAYPHHSVLLSTMDEMMTIIYTRSIHREVCVKLIKRLHLPRKLMAVVKENQQAALSQPIAAHMINLANTMSANPYAQKILRKNKEWVEFLVDVVFPVLVEQYVDEDQIPSRDSQKQQIEAEKWKKRWEEFNFLISV